MAKLTRFYQKIFGSSAGANEISKFGSLAAGSPERYSGSTISPTLVQSLSNYLGGWFDGVVGSYSPTIEDMNALFYLVTYQLSYLMQQGIPEWDASTTYYAGSVVSDGAGNFYVSATNNNTGNAPPSASWFNMSTTSQITGVYGSTSVNSANNGWLLYNYSSAAALVLQLPDPTTLPVGFSFTVKDNAGTFGTTIAGTLSGQLVRYGSEKIEGLASTYNMGAPYGSYAFYTDGTDWFRK